jgi:DNA repair protein RadC
MESLSRVSDPFKASEIELIYKPKMKASERAVIRCSQDALGIFRASWDENKIQFVEEFKIMVLNRANQVLGIYKASQGGTYGTVLDIRLVFAAAIKANACGIILAHNHPSGQLMPSAADRELTEQIKKAGKILEIAVLDHFILTDEGHLSFVDMGIF